MSTRTLVGLATATALVACDDIKLNAPDPAPAARSVILLEDAGFMEEFDALAVDPAWEVREYAGPVPRVHGIMSPANRISLTANPGRLRYILEQMTHQDGYWSGFQSTFSFHSCCNHDPGIELRRAISGEHWVLETKATYFMPYANGRQQELRVYFGDGGAGTVTAVLGRGRDVNQNWISAFVREKTGASLSDVVYLHFAYENFPVFPAPDDRTMVDVWFRLERGGSVLTASWSMDGVAWNTFLSVDMGAKLDGKPQRVVVAGASWFVPAGSYAEYDYIRVTPTFIPVSIDIKPGSDNNTLNCKASNGVVPLAILTTPDFDAADVDHASVRFGSGGAGETHEDGSGVTRHPADADNDGDTDLVFHFRFGETGIRCSDTQATLRGHTFNGRQIRGADAISVIQRQGD